MKRRQLLQALAGAALAAPALPRAQAAAGRIVVVGGGVGGATTAKYLKLFNPALQVTLVERQPVYVRPYGSSEVLTGHSTMQSLEVGYDGLRRHGVEVLIDTATGLDAPRRLLRTAGGRSLPYDRLIVSPGIELMYDAIPGYSAAVAESRAPSGWIPGAQTALLAQQLKAMRPGGTFVIAAPPNPYRCPPGPYERAALMAEWFAKHNPRAKVLIADPKDGFVTDETMMLGWNRLYGFNPPADYAKKIAAKAELKRHADGASGITWLRGSEGGRVLKLDARNLRLETEAETIQADVLNIIPPMKAGRLAATLGLDDGTGWCPVERRDFASTRVPHVHVIGDASIADAMPKSGFSANTQAKVVARAIVEALAGRPLPEPVWENTCYALAGSEYGLFVADVFRLQDGKIARSKAPRFLPLDASPQQIRLGARYQQAWLRTFTEDVFA